jgi:hypothetical protein
MSVALSNRLRQKVKLHKGDFKKIAETPPHVPERLTSGGALAPPRRLPAT